MVPEISGATDIVFVILSQFLPFYCTNNLQNQNFEKIKKTPGDIVILHMSTINNNHMIYGSWEIERGKHNFWSFWTIFFLFTFFFYLFVPFYLLPFSKDPKNQNFEKTKNASGDIIILHKCTKKHDHMLHCSRDTGHDRCNFRFSFWAIFCPFTPPKDTKNQNFENMNKTPADIINLHMCTKNYDQMIYSSWDMVRNWWTDRLTDE